MAPELLCRTFRVPDSLADEMAGWLWRAGSVGSHERPGDQHGQLLSAYFPTDSLPTSLPTGVELLAEAPVAAVDWMAAWRAQAQPLAIGQRLLVDPREPDGAKAASDGRILLRIPARSAFGTGGHESTRLVLELLETLPLAGRRVVDVGTGAGLLSLAALALGAASALGFDVDLVAPILARHNALLNRLPARFFAGSAAAIGVTAHCDVLLVNVIPAEIAGDLPWLAQLLRADGDALFSGILYTERAAALRKLRHHGFRKVQSKRSGEWVALHCRRT